MSLEIITWNELPAAERRALLRRPALRCDALVRRRASRIIDKVRESGDAGVREITRQIDGVDIDRFRVSDAEFDRAESDLSSAAIDAIDLAIRNVTHFHEKQMPASLDLEPMPGIRCERLSRPIDSVGLYVPAGSAPLPSAAIITVSPA